MLEEQNVKMVNETISKKLGEMGIYSESNFDFYYVDSGENQSDNVFYGHELEIEQLLAYYQKNNECDFIEEVNVFVNHFNFLREIYGEEDSYIDVNFEQNQKELEVKIELYNNNDDEFAEEDALKNIEFTDSVAEILEKNGYANEVEELQIKKAFSQSEANAAVSQLLENITMSNQSKLEVVNQDLQKRICVLMDQAYI